MSRWPVLPLKGHIFEVSLRKGETNTQVLSVTNTNGFVRSLDVFDKQVFSQDTSNYKLVSFNDIAYNPSRINVGSVARCHLNDGGAVSPMYVVVRCRESLLPQYLLHFLKSDVGLQYINHRCVGAVRFQLRYIDLEQIELPIPPPSEQERIVRLLDEAEELMQLQAAAAGRTADLIQAVFYEMFGDNKAYSRKRLEDICKSPAGIKAGPFGSSLKKECYTTEGPRIYGQEQIIAGDFSIGDYHISREKYDEMRAYSVAPGDVLISLVGTYGKVALVPEDAEPGIINPRLIRMRVNQNLLLPVFLKHYLELRETQAHLQALARGQTMGVLNATLLKELTVIVPSLEQQRAFALRIAEIHAFEAEQSTIRQRLADLCQSLIQRAFQGDL
jgi:type I restriction enzyme S subunit